MQCPVKIPKLRIDLRYLPLYGEEVTLDKTDFSWPTKEEIQRWPPNVSLKSITFTTFHEIGRSVSSVRCILSNNESSPLFKTSEKRQSHQKTINFDANRPVKFVQAITGD